MAAFFKISFSSRSLAFSRRSVPRSCSAVASSCLGTPLRSSSSKSRRHWRNWFTRTPSSRATLALVLSPTAANRTASSLNSRVWCLRSLRSMTQPLAQLVYTNAQFSRHLGLGLVSNGSQPHRLELELPGMVPAFLAFHDTAPGATGLHERPVLAPPWPWSCLQRQPTAPPRA